MTDKDILKLINDDPWMMNILLAVDGLNLPDWWIGAGFVRSKVWDHLHNYSEQTPIPDIDVIYFDKKDFSAREADLESTKKEDEYQEILTKKIPEISWSVTNQARIHKLHNRKHYKNSLEALSEWSETATCIGVKLDNGKPVLASPHGIGDLVNLRVRQIPEYKTKYAHDPDLFYNRITEKKWLTKWPNLEIIN